MRSGEHTDYNDNKELGLTRGLMNSLALFIYNRDYPSVPSTVDIFNDWAKACDIRFERADEVCSVLEHIRKLAKVNRKDLKKALLMDCLFTDAEELNNEYDYESGIPDLLPCCNR